MLTIQIILFTLVAILIATAYYVKSAYSYWERRGVPYLKPIFPFGNVKKAFLFEKSLNETVIEIYNSSTERFVGIYAFFNPLLVVRDPNLIQNILVSDFATFSDAGLKGNPHIDPMANNLLFQSGDEWRRNRTKLTPAFTSNRIKEMFDAIIECGNSLHNHINKFAESSETVEIRDVCSRYLANVIASVAFGIDVDCIKNPNDKFMHYGRKIFEPTLKNQIRLYMKFLNPTLVKLLRVRFADEDVGEFMIEVVRQNLAYREKNNVKRKDFFQFLMKLKDTGQGQNDSNSRKPMSLKEVSAQSYLFFVAGFETTATAMSFCIFELAKHPEIQNKVYHEIVDILSKNDGKLTYESFDEMKYLDNCLNEALRLHLPIGTLCKQCTKDYKIPDSDVVIKYGDSILIPIAAIHTDSKYYDHPHQFIPERFDQSANKSFVERPFFPFGEGPRSCIGYRLAKLMIKVGIALLFQQFDFELDPKHINKELKMNPAALVKNPIGGLNLKVKTRNKL